MEETYAEWVLDYNFALSMVVILCSWTIGLPRRRAGEWSGASARGGAAAATGNFAA
jgi:hypothetical protein